MSFLDWLAEHVWIVIVLALVVGGVIEDCIKAWRDKE